MRKYMSFAPLLGCNKTAETYKVVAVQKECCSKLSYPNTKLLNKEVNAQDWVNWKTSLVKHQGLTKEEKLKAYSNNFDLYLVTFQD